MVKNVHGSELNGRTLYVGRAQKKAERAAELKARFEALKQVCESCWMNPVIIHVSVALEAHISVFDKKSGDWPLSGKFPVQLF